MNGIFWIFGTLLIWAKQGTFICVAYQIALEKDLWCSEFYPELPPPRLWWVSIKVRLRCLLFVWQLGPKLTAEPLCPLFLWARESTVTANLPTGCLFSVGRVGFVVISVTLSQFKRTPFLLSFFFVSLDRAEFLYIVEMQPSTQWTGVFWGGLNRKIQSVTC